MHTNDFIEKLKIFLTNELGAKNILITEIESSKTPMRLVHSPLMRVDLSICTGTHKYRTRAEVLFDTRIDPKKLIEAR